MERVWGCLARCGERLAGFEAGDVRAVATQTLLEAHNMDEFLTPAQELLGFPIDVISSVEEVRLIYQGFVQTMPDGQAPRSVFDICGRSTDLIFGQCHHDGVMMTLYANRCRKRYRYLRFMEHYF